MSGQNGDPAMTHCVHQMMVGGSSACVVVRMAPVSPSSLGLPLTELLLLSCP
jgi:hypothetical protein